MKNGFFAYASSPSYSGEFIEESIKNINDNGVIKIQSWKEIRISGSYIIYPILKKIEESDFFCADLTGLNDNVLFEIGFAMGKRKPIWLIMDTSNLETIRKFKEFSLLTTVGYSSYNNSVEIVENFYHEAVYESNHTINDEIFSNISSKHGERALFYIKGQVDTNYSQEILNIIESKKLPYIIDDPVESKMHPLNWYLEQLHSVPAFLAEFSSTYRTGHEIHNSKCSLISGFALGLGLRVLMVAEKPYPTPIDYKELLNKYENRNSCKEVVGPFLSELHEEIAELLIKKRESLDRTQKRSKLQKINFGEFIAEHESENLYNYFVETAHYHNLIKSEHNIVVGRKGTGKTATLYFINDELLKDVRNHICLIKPINFEVDGLVALLKNLNNEFERGFMIESIWKFLIYTEIAKSLFSLVKDRPLYARNHEEQEFITYVNANESIILSDFSTRLEQELKALTSTSSLTSQQDYRIKIAEILHDGVIKTLKNHIKAVLATKRKLIVLIDNLDKSWRKDSDINVLSNFILGLLGVVGRIANDFKLKTSEKHKFTFHLTLFLRSDIFKHLLTIAREPDKIEVSRLRWNDPEILFRIIEERFVELSELNVLSDDLWTKFIASEIENKDCKVWILEKVLPRPRDIIYFFNVAKNFAVSRGHSLIEEKDLVSAYVDYSNWVFQSVLVENGITVKQMEEFMYHLMGESQILSSGEIQKIMLKAGIPGEKLDGFIDHLVSLTIIGREIRANEYEYEYELDNGIKLKILSEKLGSNRFKIHEAFTSYLECKTS